MKRSPVSSPGIGFASCAEPFRNRSIEDNRIEGRIKMEKEIKVSKLDQVDDPTTQARVALITGASRGLGLALARALASRGWRLIIDARGADALERVRAELAKTADVIAVPGDVAQVMHHQALVNAARA